MANILNYLSIDINHGEQIVQLLDSQEEKHLTTKFPREQNNAPRMKIIRKECPNEFQDFLKCQEQNPSKLQLCVPVREKLFECGKPGFKKANTDENYIY